MSSQTIGLISDTHGMLRPEAIRALQGVSLIIHAGDVGDDDILDRLRVIAPVVAVRGNMDREPWALDLPLMTTTEVGNFLFHVLHDLSCLHLDQKTAGLTAVVSGHTHWPEARRDNGVHYFNPGSAGPVRQNKPVSLMLLHIEDQEIRSEIVELD